MENTSKKTLTYDEEQNLKVESIMTALKAVYDASENLGNLLEMHEPLTVAEQSVKFLGEIMTAYLNKYAPKVVEYHLVDELLETGVFYCDNKHGVWDIGLAMGS